MLPHAIILAGGAGRRMGGADKAALMLAGQPLVAHVIARLRPQVAALALSANGDAARFAALGLPVLPDVARMGPLSGILQGLRHAAASGASALVSVPVDAPFLPEDLVARLMAAAGPQGCAMAGSGGSLHPVFGLWPVAAADALEAFLASGQKARIRAFAESLHAGVAEFPDIEAFRNLNTPEDLALAEAGLA